MSVDSYTEIWPNSSTQKSPGLISVNSYTEISPKIGPEESWVDETHWTPTLVLKNPFHA